MLNSYEKDLLLRAQIDLEKSAGDLAASSLQLECQKIAMDMVSTGKRTPFTSYEELRSFALEVAEKDPEIYKKAMQIAINSTVPGLVHADSRPEKQESHEPNDAENDYLNKLKKE